MAEPLPLAAAAAAVIGTCAQEPLLSTVAALITALWQRILQALQRPGLAAAAEAAVPGSLLRLGALLAYDAAANSSITSAFAVCTAPAAVEFALSCRSASRGCSPGMQVRYASLAAMVAEGIQQPGNSSLAATAAAAAPQQRLVLLHAAARLAAWLSTCPAQQPPELPADSLYAKQLDIMFRSANGQLLAATGRQIWRTSLRATLATIDGLLKNARHAQLAVPRQTADLLCGTLTVLLLCQTATPWDGLPVEHDALKGIFCHRTISGAAGQIPLRNLCTAIQAAAAATLVACRSSNAAQQALAAGALPCIADAGFLPWWLPRMTPPPAPPRRCRAVPQGTPGASS